ncbi:hypothetical protein SEA_JACKO_12 [Microbacterium phage Jacko]|nr:hypothetical protein SEA_JACKO_12 [Microbacterium phage Jacko]
MSDMKDARWQLASEMAATVGFDFYGPDVKGREAYLENARLALQGAPPEHIKALAARYRDEDIESDAESEVIEAAKLYRVNLGRNPQGKLVVESGTLENIVDFYHGYRSEIEEVI